MTFTQADIKRAIRAVEAAGENIAAVDFPPSGGFRLVLGELLSPNEPNEWDDIFNLP